MNVDGAIFSDLKAVGLGAIIKDEKGCVVATLSRKIHTPLGVVEAEAKAVEMGLQFAKDIGVCDIILEGDSLNVYRALLGLLAPSPLVDAMILGGAKCMLKVPLCWVLLYSMQRKQTSPSSSKICQGH